LYGEYENPYPLLSSGVEEAGVPATTGPATNEGLDSADVEGIAGGLDSETSTADGTEEVEIPDGIGFEIGASPVASCVTSFDVGMEAIIELRNVVGTAVGEDGCWTNAPVVVDTGTPS
jgi:hypothetical protein